MNFHLRYIAILLFACCAFTRHDPVSKKAPNIVFIVVDDMGWADLGCYGNEIIETPNLDRLAAEGMQFRQAYASAAVCSPNRAALLTGKHPARLHITDWIPGMVWPKAKLNTPAIRYELPHEEITIAEVLKKENYDTWFVGKWHLGDSAFYPPAQGFDLNYGGHSKGHPASHFFPFGNTPGKPATHAVLNLPPGSKEGDYLDDFLTTQAMELIRKSKTSGRPFFLNFWPYGVHMPLEGKPDLVEKYKAKIGQAGSKFNPVYCAMVEDIDQNVGRLLRLLEEPGIAENTLFIFTSDNGGLEEINGNLPLRAGKGHLYEGGIRVPLIMKHPGKIPAGAISDRPVSAIDFFPTILEYLLLKSPVKVDGTSFSSVLSGQTGKQKAPPIIWHYPHYHTSTRPPQSAIRSGTFKLIHFYEDGRDELYNIATDPKEKINLVSPKMRRKTKSLHRQLMKSLEQYGADFPKPNPDYDPDDPFGGAYAGWKGENRRKDED